MEEFARTIRRELDLAREGRLIERVASQFAGDLTVRFPRIHWPLTTSTVLTMEFLDGVKVSEVGTDAAPRPRIPQIVARRGADMVIKQILVHRALPRRPHPGNILVLPGNVVAIIDFGIVGRVNQQLREGLAETILAIGRHDAERLTDIVLAVAMAMQPVEVGVLTRDIEEMLDLNAGLALGDLSLGEVLASVIDAMSRHRLKLPADLLLLIKAVTTVESVGRQLDPTFKIVEHAAPLVERLIAQNHSPRALARRSADASREILGALRTLTESVAAIARNARRDGVQIQFVHRNLGLLH